MARFSQTAHQIKVESQDTVKMFGMRGTVLAVEVLRPIQDCTNAGVLLVVDFTHGKGEPTILNLSDVEAVRYDGEWVNWKGEPVLDC